MYFVYILKSKVNGRKTYVGYTNDLKRRLACHNRGECSYTQSGAPWEIAYFELLEKDIALARERQIKCWSRAKKEALIVGRLVELKGLSKKY